MFGARIQTLVSTDANIERAVRDADLVIGSALILHESVNWVTGAAIAAILIGLVFSQKGNHPV